MATGTETKIAEALLARLGTLSPAMPMQAPNVDYNPVVGTPYLRAFLLPRTTAAATPVSVGAAGLDDHGGVFQVSVFYPNGSGITPSLEKASAVAALFARGTRLFREGVRVEVLQPPSVERPLQENSWFQVPVSIPYRAFT